MCVRVCVWFSRIVDEPAPTMAPQREVPSAFFLLFFSVFPLHPILATFCRSTSKHTQFDDPTRCSDALVSFSLCVVPFPILLSSALPSFSFCVCVCDVRKVVPLPATAAPLLQHHSLPPSLQCSAHRQREMASISFSLRRVTVAAASLLFCCCIWISVFFPGSLALPYYSFGVAVFISRLTQTREAARVTHEMGRKTVRGAQECRLSPPALWCCTSLLNAPHSAAFVSRVTRGVRLCGDVDSR